MVSWTTWRMFGSFVASALVFAFFGGWDLGAVMLTTFVLFWVSGRTDYWKEKV